MKTNWSSLLCAIYKKFSRQLFFCALSQSQNHFFTREIKARIKQQQPPATSSTRLMVEWHYWRVCVREGETLIKKPTTHYYYFSDNNINKKKKGEKKKK